MSTLFHYQDCGLPNIWLRNGFDIMNTPFGEAVSIHNVTDLHAAIGLYLTENKVLLNGADIRFLRKELDFSQLALAEVLGVSESTMRNWETERQAITIAADRMLRLIYREYIEGSAVIRALVEKINHLEAKEAEKLELEELETGWKVAA